MPVTVASSTDPNAARLPGEAMRTSKPFWLLFVAVTGLLAIARFFVADIIGACSAWLLLLMAVAMVRDQTRMVRPFVVLFCTLSMVSFCFDFLVLLASLDGRTATHTHLVSSEHHGSELRTYYEQETRKTPFFDAHRGCTYNIESLSMLLAPVVGLYGSLLGVWTHNAMANEMNMHTLLAEEAAARQSLVSSDVPVIAPSLRGPAGPGPCVSAGAASAAQYQTFTGKAFKLPSDP